MTLKIVYIIEFDFSWHESLIGAMTRSMTSTYTHRPNSPGPLTDDSSVNFHEVFFFIFCQLILAKNEEKQVMEIYG